MADIITYPENGITYDAEDASGYLSTRLSGVYSAEEDFSVTAQGGLSVQVSAGQAWVRPARFKGRSIIMEQPATVVLTEADPVRSRIDRVVLRYDAAAKKRPACRCWTARRTPLPLRPRKYHAPSWSMTSALPRSDAPQAPPLSPPPTSPTPARMKPSAASCGTACMASPPPSCRRR